MSEKLAPKPGIELPRFSNRGRSWKRLRLRKNMSEKLAPKPEIELPRLSNRGRSWKRLRLRKNMSEKLAPRPGIELPRFSSRGRSWKRRRRRKCIYLLPLRNSKSSIYSLLSPAFLHFVFLRKSCFENPGANYRELF